MEYFSQILLIFSSVAVIQNILIKFDVSSLLSEQVPRPWKISKMIIIDILDILCIFC